MASIPKDMPKEYGPENVPIKGYIIEYKWKVTAYDPNKNDEVVRECEMDYGQPNDRKWLGRFTVWATMQGYIVETEAVSKPVFDE